YRSTSDSTYGVISNLYDALGRIVTVIPQDGYHYVNNTRTAYGGNFVITTDPAGNQRKRVFDSLGRVVEVHEPGPITAAATHSGGTYTVTGPEQTHTDPGVQATGSFTVSGVSTTGRYCDDTGCHTSSKCSSVGVAVNGVWVTSPFLQSDTAAGVAAKLAQSINTTSGYPATATVSSNVINVTSVAFGPNYPLSTQV